MVYIIKWAIQWTFFADEHMFPATNILYIYRNYFVNVCFQMLCCCSIQSAEDSVQETLSSNPAFDREKQIFLLDLRSLPWSQCIKINTNRRIYASLGRNELINQNEGSHLPFQICNKNLGNWGFVVARKYFSPVYSMHSVCSITTPPLKRFRSGSLWKYINGSSQNMIDIKRLNYNHATWVSIIENNISGHIFHKRLFLLINVTYH